ncbi:unnamed protein product [Sphenostylis stenocarpa]|uniref:Uncharacterized protein n=1 Tax=Sphenostylis stenocarpa TaxID=92480 RepID=A0AA86SWC4_9FABA|nr:unnamed protein product [Sphenostylis stenocarpa]
MHLSPSHDASLSSTRHDVMVFLIRFLQEMAINLEKELQGQEEIEVGVTRKYVDTCPAILNRRVGGSYGESNSVLVVAKRPL